MLFWEASAAQGWCHLDSAPSALKTVTSGKSNSSQQEQADPLAVESPVHLNSSNAASPKGPVVVEGLQNDSALYSGEHASQKTTLKLLLGCADRLWSEHGALQEQRGRLESWEWHFFHYVKHFHHFWSCLRCPLSKVVGVFCGSGPYEDTWFSTTGILTIPVW